MAWLLIVTDLKNARITIRNSLSGTASTRAKKLFNENYKINIMQQATTIMIPVKVRNILSNAPSYLNEAHSLKNILIIRDVQYP